MIRSGNFNKTSQYQILWNPLCFSRVITRRHTDIQSRADNRNVFFQLFSLGFRVGGLKYLYFAYCKSLSPEINNYANKTHWLNSTVTFSANSHNFPNMHIIVGILMDKYTLSKDCNVGSLFKHCSNWNTSKIQARQCNRKHICSLFKHSSTLLRSFFKPLHRFPVLQAYCACFSYRHWCFIPGSMGRVYLLSYFTSQIQYRRIHTTMAKDFCCIFYNRSRQTRIIFHIFQ